MVESSYNTDYYGDEDNKKPSFINKIKLYNNQASISYNVHPIRLNIVDSWPSSIDDSGAKKEWGWNFSNYKFTPYGCFMA